MSAHIDELLPEHAAGTLAGEPRARVESHLAGCRRCTRELAAIADAYAALALALPPAPPPPGLRERILRDVARAGRFDMMGERVAALLDLAPAQARALLSLIDEPDRWEPGPAGTRLLRLPAGPAAAGASCGFVRLEGGARFPLHRHLGDEIVLVLQGGLEDSDGRVLQRGDEDRKPAGSEHALAALPGTDLVCLVVLHDGLDIVAVPGLDR